MDLRWLIPLIGVAVWIISQIASNQREAARRLPRSQPPRLPDDFPEADNPKPQPKASAELDRFLEEVRRRQQTPPRPEPVQPRPRAPVVEPVRPKKAPPSPASAFQPIKIRGIPAEEPVAVALPVVPQPTPAVPTPITVPPSVSKPAASQAILQVQSLLRQRRSLASAMLLREIFDRPVSQRPRRR